MARPADPNARSALVAAALRAFVQHGIQQARIEDITSACGLSKGAFYLHFESKEALFGELVGQLKERVAGLMDARQREYEAFFRRAGPVRPREAATGSARLRELEAMEAQHDRATLEAMWELREVMAVLLRGTQGTAFDEVMWSYIDHEQQRVAESVERLKKLGLCRPDLPAEVVGAMVVGTWVFMARRMASAKEKPDLDTWVSAIRRVISEGTSPRREAPRPQVASTRKPARRAARHSAARARS